MTIVKQSTNRLLEHLPADYKTMLLGRMEEVTLTVPHTLYQPGEVPLYAHFMTSGITSIVSFMEDGHGVEVGLLGADSVVEGFHLLGPSRVQTTGMVQVSGSALRMPFKELGEEFQKSRMLHSLILQAVQGQGLIVQQLAACNRLHEVEERLARWLLTVCDLLGKREFYLTQEFLAEMIGAERTTVTLAAGSLQRSGLIEYRRGRICIIDLDGLGSAACECYPIVRDLTTNLYQ